jgi:hypothetical protein
MHPMGRLSDLLDDLAARPGWSLLPVEDAAWEAPPAAPADLDELRRRCGGIRTPGGLVVAHRVRSAQAAILGEAHPDDRSFHWYVIAETDDSSTSERAVVDLHPDRLGRCYDAFWDRFAIAGSMPVIAESVTELLERLRHADGDAYWSDLREGSADAYD